jgi:hypothetical protein
VAVLLETVGPKTGAAPLTYTLTEQGTVDLQSVFAHFNGAGASGAWRPTCTVRSQNGTILSRTFPVDELAAGDTADVTFAPLLRAAVPAAPALPTYNALVLADPTLVMYYECGEASGTLVDSKLAQNMAPVGSPLYGLAGPLPPATAVGSNGAANYWTVAPANADSFFGNFHPFTIEGFLYVTASGSSNDPLFSVHRGAAQIDLGCSFGSKQLSLQRAGDQTPTTAAQAITTGTWHYVVGTYDGSDLRCYLDATLIGGPTASAGSVGTFVGCDQAIAARGFAFTGFLNGRAANVAIYNAALSDATILAHYLRWLGVA